MPKILALSKQSKMPRFLAVANVFGKQTIVTDTMTYTKQAKYCPSLF